MRILAISGSLRRGSHNTSLLRAAEELLSPLDTFELWDGLREVPPYDSGRRRRARPSRGGGAPRRGRRGGRRPDRDAGVQLVDPGRAQERARLGLAPDRDERVPLEAGRRDRIERGHVRRGLGPGGAPQGARARWAHAWPRSRSPSGAPRRSSTTGAASSTTTSATSLATRSRPSPPRRRPALAARRVGLSPPAGRGSPAARLPGAAGGPRSARARRRGGPRRSTTGTRS